VVDATIAPILWRLPRYEIEIGSQAPALERYGQQMFARPAFRASLSEAEIELGVI
jgi:RNA polymerase-associated protein